MIIGYLLLVLHIIFLSVNNICFSIYIDDESSAADLDIFLGTDGYGREQSSNWRRYSWHSQRALWGLQHLHTSMQVCRSYFHFGGVTITNTVLNHMHINVFVGDSEILPFCVHRHSVARQFIKNKGRNQTWINHPLINKHVWMFCSFKLKMKNTTYRI